MADWPLELELVPSSSWGDNVRSRMTRSRWDVIRKATYRDAGYRCEICGAEGRLEAHEIWAYDDEHFVQTLVRTIALCSLCHSAKHIGRTLSVLSTWQASKVLRHIMRLNHWTEARLNAEIDLAFGIWEARSQHAWIVDITWLDRVS
jgi:hypothetical protein